MCNVKWDGSLYYLKWQPNRDTKEYLPEELALSSFEKKKLKDTALAWHKRYGHISIDAIRKLEDATDGARVTTSEIYGKNEDDLQEKCEICALNDASRQISSVPVPKLTRTFHTLYADIIVMNKAITGDEYALHVVCPVSRFHGLVTIDTKAVVPDIIAMLKKFVNTFQTKVLVIHTGGESALNGHAFRKYCEEEGKQLFVTVADIPEQNGPSENAGGLIAKRAKAQDSRSTISGHIVAIRYEGSDIHHQPNPDESPRLENTISESVRIKIICWQPIRIRVEGIRTCQDQEKE